MRLTTTPSQTVGPFFSIGMRPVDIVVEPAAEKLTIQGRVLDGDGNGVSDAVIETWQANADGHYAGDSCSGWGRVATDSAGRFHFSTVKPGRVVAEGDEVQAPHIAVTIFTRGLLKHLVTRIYFPNEPSNATDHILSLVPAGRRASLIARPLAPNKLEWNIVLQGEDETVFFEC
jgi:protocatechuate 3,4-dioxygenase, alpha subunit